MESTGSDLILDFLRTDVTAANSSSLLEILVLFVYTVVAGALTVMGAAAEYMSLQYLGSGELVVAIWLAAMGAIMLYAGVYGIGYQKLLTTVVR